MKDEEIDFNIKRPRLMERLIKDENTRLNIRILILMLLVAVAVYHITALDICLNFENTTLDKKDKLGFFYECRYYNETELYIIEKSKITPIDYNITQKYINN